jgi:hypothetical protein
MRIRLDKKRKRAMAVTTVIVAMLAGAALMPFGTTLGQGSPAAGTLVSLNTDTAPTVDGVADEAIWADAEELVVSVVGGGANGDVTFKSVFTDTDIYIYAEWDDPTMSLTRGTGAWEYNGTGFENLDSGSEDRLALMWEIGTITDFATDGCMVKCHLLYGSAGAFLETEGEKGDTWHMKAARSLPVTSASQEGTPTIGEDHQATAGKFMFSGWLDDKVLTYDEEPHEDDGGRHGDEGSSTYSRNRNEAKTGPLWIESNPADYIDAMVLTQVEIDGGEAIDVATASNESLATAWAIYEGFGAVVPERILSPPSGSRADVTQAAVWEDGKWSTEMARKLVTNNDDDVQFDDLDAGYLFGVSVMDDSGGADHSQTATDVFELVFYTPPTEYVITAGPITDKDGMSITDVLVTLDNNGTTLTGTTDADGNVTITVPADWADTTVTVTMSKDGYKDATFEGTISDMGEFSPTSGSIPDILKEEKKDDDDESPGFSLVVMMLALVIATLLAVTARRD